LDKGNGVLLLTDIYGATPSNIALRLCKPGHVAGVAGVSLAMLLRAVCGPAVPLATLVQRAMQGGRDCIVTLTADSE
jgi:PTS system ascorbate-specific IIA component